MDKGFTASKVIRGVFLAAFLAFVFSLVVAKGVAAMGLPLPNWIVQDETNSVLEGRNYQQFPKVSLASFLDKEFQGDFEQWVSDLTPRRDDVIQANAALQRGAIDASAALFGFNAAPTFFGSDYSYDPEHDVLAPLPAKEGSPFADALPDAVQAINGFAERHRDKNIVFGNVDRLEFSDLNPLHDLVADSVSREHVERQFLDKLDGVVTVLQLAPETQEEYFSSFFRTDHHWNTPAAFSGYEKCLSVLRPEDKPIAIEGEVTWNDVPFFGARARSALMETEQPDYLVDYLYEESPLVVDFKGEGDAEKLRHRELYGAGDYDHRRFANHYADYFHADPPLFTIENPSLPSGDTLLVVGDSYTNAMERFLAEHYAKVVVVDPRHLDKSLDDVVAEYDPDDILFLMAGYTYTNSDTLEVIEG